MVKSKLDKGKHDITCPWVVEHTSEIDHGTVYYEPSEENKSLGGFKCQHGHCANRTIVDLRAFLGITKDGSKVNNLLEIALELVDQFHVFRDENGDPFVYLNGSCLPLKSREVKAHILRTIKVSAGKALKLGNLAEVLASLESKAICGDEELKLHLRIAKHKGYFWYDLGNGKAIKVGRKDWEIVEPPPLFRRYRHQQVQNEPIKGGDPWKLFDFMNISKKNHLETLVMLITYLIPDIAHPIFHPHGAHGSGKSTICKMIKELIDPSSLGVIIAPKNRMELVRLINRHHVSIFDNMSKLDSEMSDVLCVASTGGSVPKRELYSDDEDVIFNFQRCCGLNGINLLVSKPDLLDRTLLLHMTRIPSDKRKTDEDLWRAFNKAKPEILGGMFDILSKAKSNYKSVKLSELPRMADFAKWGYAIAEAFGKGKGKQFIADYQVNIKRQNAEVLQYNSLCLAVTLFMKSRKYWEGTVQAAYDALFELVNPIKTDGTFPADSKNLRRFLERIESILTEAEHITYSASERPKKDGFHIEFWKHK
jgi:energy-coupling factor transporter ATP-binding protein EcfA2